MLFGRISFKAVKLHGIRFAVTCCCTTNYMILRPTELVSENLKLCFYLPSRRYFASKSDSGNGNKLNDIENGSSTSKIDVLNALSQSESLQNTESDHNVDEAKIPHIPSVIRYAIPSLFVRDSSCTTRTDCIPVDSYCEIQSYTPMSKALQNLCFKLNVPCDIVFGYSACEGLKKILESTDKRESIYQKHVDVIDELLGLVQEQIQTKEDTLFKDFLFYNFIVKDFPVWLFRVSFRRFELAMNNEKYTLLELLDFAKKLRAVETSVFDDVKYRQFELLLTSIWNQISMQEHLITSSVLARMYKEAPTNNVRVFQKLHTAFLKHISALDLKNVLMILNVKEPLDHSKKLSTIAMWIVSTFEDRTVNDLENLMSGYLQYSYVCPEMMKTLKQIVQSVHSDKNMTPKLMCQIISYCKKGLHYDHWLLKKACSHYIDNTEHYTSENLHSLLEAIGVLNYIPESEKVFFTEVEEYLTKNFYNIEISLLLDMFVYLIYLDKPAVNFLPCIFAPVLTNFVYEFEGEKKKRAAENLHLIRTAFKRHSLSPMVLPFDIDNTPSLIDTNNRIVYDTLIDVLRNSKYVKLGRRPTFIGESYFIMNFTDLAVWADVKIPETRNKFAILIVTENSYCKNISDQMLGYEAANIRILTRIGVTVAQIHYRQIERLREKNQLSGFLTSLLMQQVLDTADLLMLEETAEDIEDSDMSDLIYAE